MTERDERIERATRVVPTTAEQIFELLADPASHPLIDGSGTVRESIGSERLQLGTKFGMKMRLGLPYRITNEVVEFDEPNQIAWRHMGGHIWRYILRPVGEGADAATEVTEEFDWRPSKLPLQLVGVPKRNLASMEATLDRLVAHFS